MSIVDSTVIREMLRAVNTGRTPRYGGAPSDSIKQVALAGWLIIAVFFGGIGSWALTAPLNGAVVGNAVVKVDGNRKSVQHLDGGIVKELRVKEGERVMPATSCLCSMRPRRGPNTMSFRSNTWSFAPPKHAC